MRYRYDDGGRAEAGRKGKARDCVTRAIAIAAGLPYERVYADIAAGNAAERVMSRSDKRISGVSSASGGVHTHRKWFKDYMRSLGFTWTPTMAVGSGCRVHLRDGELPQGRLVAAVSCHYTAVIDGVIRDTHDPSRDGTRCVYGYWWMPSRKDQAR